jgi:DNA polymerase III delta subunit
MPAPFLLITGDNPPERQAQEAKALAAWLGEGNDALSRHVFQGGETDPDSLLTAMTPSLFASKCAVVVRGAQECPAAVVEVLTAQIPGAMESDIAVIVVGEKGPNATTKAGKAFAALAKKIGKEIPCAAPKVQELPGWVAKVCKERFKRGIDRMAAELLVERAGTTDFRAVGETLGDLERELEKLDGCLDPGQPIPLKLVEDLVGDRRPVSLQDLQAALLARRPAAAVDAWHRLRHEGLPAFLLAQTCYSDFLSAYRLRTALDQGLGLREAASELGINFWLVEKRGLGAAAKGRSIERWRKDLLRLCQIEAADKRGGYPFEHQLDLEFYQLAL